MSIIVNDPTPLIAHRIRDSRRANGWSLDELARRSGVSKAMLSKIERCQASPTAALLGKISGALGIR
jgi:transcriptional regulator with XRE-family HTH domain